MAEEAGGLAVEAIRDWRKNLMSNIIHSNIAREILGGISKEKFRLLRIQYPALTNQVFRGYYDKDKIDELSCILRGVKRISVEPDYDAILNGRLKYGEHTREVSAHP